MRSANPIEVIARRAHLGEGSFSLKISQIRVCRKGVPKHDRRYQVVICARVKLPHEKAVVVQNVLDADDADIDVDTTLRELLKRTDELSLDLDADDDDEPVEERDPVVAADSAQRNFIVSLTPSQRARLGQLLKNLQQFRSEVMSGWSAADVEPRLASPRSSLMNIPGEID